MKVSVCFVFAVACWIAAQAEESTKILTLSKVMNELKINQGMVKSTTLKSPTINDLKEHYCLDPCWTLEEYINFLLFTVSEADKDSITIFQSHLTPIMQLSPEPGQPSLHVTDTKPEPTADRELTPAMMNKPATEKLTEPRITLEPEPHSSEEEQKSSSAESPAQAENVLRSVLTCQGIKDSKQAEQTQELEGPTESKTGHEQQRSDNTHTERQPDIGSADELHLWPL